MAGLESLQSKIKKIGEKAHTVFQGKRLSVVYMDADRVIDWPDNAASGVLIVPRPMSVDEWVRRYG